MLTLMYNCVNSRSQLNISAIEDEAITDPVLTDVQCRLSAMCLCKRL